MANPASGSTYIKFTHASAHSECLLSQEAGQHVSAPFTLLLPVATVGATNVSQSLTVVQQICSLEMNRCGMHHAVQSQHQVPKRSPNKTRLEPRASVLQSTVTGQTPAPCTGSHLASDRLT